MKGPESILYFQAFVIQEDTNIYKIKNYDKERML
jgi:hypothetical protein